MSHLKSVSTIEYITMLLIIGFADCNSIAMHKRAQSCFLEIQIFGFTSQTDHYLSGLLRYISLQREPHTFTIGSKFFQESLNEEKKFYINCKSLCNRHVFVQPPISDGYLEAKLNLRYEILHLITTNCLKNFTTIAFTTTHILVNSLGCRTKQSRNFLNAYATLFRAFPRRIGGFGRYLFQIYPLLRGLKAITFHPQIEIIGPNREFNNELNFKTDSDQTIAEIVMDSMNISAKNAISNIYTTFTAGFNYYDDPDVTFKVKFFSRFIQEQIVYCPKHKNYQKMNHLSLLFLLEPFHTFVSIVIAITLITSALYLNFIAGKRPRGIWKQFEMFMYTLLIVFQILLGQERVKKTKSVLLLLLGIPSIMLVSTYKDLISVRLVAPENILEPSVKNLSVLKDQNYHIIFCPYDCLLSKFILSNLLREYENSSLKNVGFHVRGKGDMYNGKSFEINNFLKRKTNCDSLENALSYQYTYIVYNNLRYREAIFKTRVLKESGVTNFIERNKYEIYNWNSIKRRPYNSHPKYIGGVFRLARKHIWPFAILLLGMLCVDFIAILREVYNFREKNAVRRIVHGCFGIYSYIFPFKAIHGK